MLSFELRRSRVFSMGEDDRDNDAVVAFDAGIDILVGLIAVILLSVIAILPMANLANSRNSEIDRVMSQIMREQPGASDDNRRLLFLAGREELIVSGPSPVVIPVDDILDDRWLWSTIKAGVGRGSDPVLFISETGQESAFLLETLLSRAGYPDISRVFLDRTCSFFETDYRPGKCNPGPRRLQTTGAGDA